MKATPREIRLIVSDLDGVWTDGKIIYSGDAREIKEFNVRDGLGVKLAQAAGIEVAVLTSRRSKAVERRCRELGIHRVVQGAADKTAEMKQMAKEAELPLAAVLYVGDDLPDLGPMHAAGLSAAPADAAPEVVELADWKLAAAGGRGAVRELIERLLRERGEWASVLERFHGSKIEVTGV
ncbi:MAG TPA: HAD-IIIA family hydrolase [Thermoanaerobaculia bacterium]|nr:HAD-IIIA family hydrolase [Thermoanaerobaculia bacterium]